MDFSDKQVLPNTNSYCASNITDRSSLLGAIVAVHVTSSVIAAVYKKPVGVIGLRLPHNPGFCIRGIVSFGSSDVGQPICPLHEAQVELGICPISLILAL